MSKRTFFTETETNLLKELVSKHINVVECKRTDHKSISSKAKAWEDITEEFNSFSMAGLNKRNDKQLKKCWDNMKMREKKKAAEERRERLRTGRKARLNIFHQCEHDSENRNFQRRCGTDVDSTLL